VTTVAVSLVRARLDGSAGGAVSSALDLLRELVREPRGLRYRILAAPDDADALREAVPGADVVAVARGPAAGGPGDGRGRLGALAADGRRRVRAAAWTLAPAAEAAVRGVARFAPGLVAPLRALGADVLFCPLTRVEPYDPTVPSVATVHDLLHAVRPDLLPPEEVRHRRRFLAATFRRGALFAAYSEATREDVLRVAGLAPSRVRTIHPCVRVPAPDDGDAAARDAEPFALYPANLWPHKNHDLLLEAFRLLRERRPSRPLRLVLTGHPLGRAGSLRARIAALGLADAAQWRGWVPRAELLGLLRRAAFLVFPSLHEGFGLPVVEAMASGCAVACSRAGSLPEVAGGAAILFDPSSAASAADAMAALRDDAGLRANLAARGRENARRFDPAAAAEAHRALFREASAASAASEDA
jgi:glycosyltransferase involved in cell wall biosynthesis